MNILVLCTGNSARSVMLQSIFNRLGKGRIVAFSAGPEPAIPAHPKALALLAEKSYPVSGETRQSQAAYAKADAPKMDVVIDVNAQDNPGARFPGAPLRGHWGIQDPASLPSAPKAAFEVAFAVLEARAKAWLSLDFERMDAATRQHHITRIGEASLVM